MNNSVMTYQPGLKQSKALRDCLKICLLSVPVLVFALIPIEDVFAAAPAAREQSMTLDHYLAKLESAAAKTPPEPGTGHEPQDVVKIVIDALKTNSEADGDSGIAVVYSFASPGNRASTGPLERFTRMVKTGFSDMLNHQAARFEPMEIADGKAVQAVWLLTGSGSWVGYAFQLSRQQGGDYDGFWMTDAVVPVAKDGTGI